MKVSKSWRRAGGILLGVLAFALGFALLLLSRSGGDEAGHAKANGKPSKEAPGAAREAPDPSRQTVPRAAGATPSQRPEVIAQVPWGSGLGRLGRRRPAEGNPEAPMSLAVTPHGDILVLDQVNERIVRFGSDGKARAEVSVTQQAPQDITVAQDGTLAVLDRLGDKTVALIDPEANKLKGELPLKGKSIPDPGLVTGTFVLDGSVYVEREHAALVRIGDLSGQADPTQPVLPGRPSRDGEFFLAARISDSVEGRLVVYFLDRWTYEQRMARELWLQFPLLYITLLDTDLAGTVYVAVVGQLPTGKANPPNAPGMRLYCLEPAEGKVIGQAELIYSPMPEETFRDLVVLDEGGIVYQVRTEAGVTLRRADCR